jgi:hypothetical protein
MGHESNAVWRRTDRNESEELGIICLLTRPGSALVLVSLVVCRGGFMGW